MTRRVFFLQLATLALAMFAIDRALAWYAPNHYIPEARMRAALTSGDGCVVFVGDSRMVAGYDAAALARGFASRGTQVCTVNVAIGALKVSGMAVALREYLERGGKPRTIVIGNAADKLLPEEQPLDPATFIGNEAVQLAWSHPSDVRTLYPGFPAANVLAFDQGFRFLAARSTALGTYLSIGWQKVQAAQDRFAGRPKLVNAFGALEDMDAYGAKLERDARRRLAAAVAGPEAQRLDRSYLLMEQLARDAGAKLVIVELPMPARFRDNVSRAPEARAFRAWLGQRSAASGGAMLDLSDPDWNTPEHFADVLHLNERGAAAFSEQLGRELAGLP